LADVLFFWIVLFLKQMRRTHRILAGKL